MTDPIKESTDPVPEPDLPEPSNDVVEEKPVPETDPEAEEKP